ncbi:MAG: DNA-binding protein [Spirochaetales bacterium]|nr:DNA-binding protein [Spirochaetales bacterium]
MIDFSAYGVKTPEVKAVKCPSCGKLHYPAPMICNKCGERRDPSGVIFKHWETVSLSGECTLLAWTRVYALPDGLDMQYLLFGIVEFPNGLRASGRLEVDQPVTGMKVNARAETMDNSKGKEFDGLIFGDL